MSIQAILERTRDFDKVSPHHYTVAPVRNVIEEMPSYDIHAMTPTPFDAIDTIDAYDISMGEYWVNDLTPAQTLVLLKRVRSQYMTEINKLQKDIDRITLLEMSVDDPRCNTPWPRYYELRVRPERSKI